MSHFESSSSSSSSCVFELISETILAAYLHVDFSEFLRGGCAPPRGGCTVDAVDVLAWWTCSSELTPIVRRLKPQSRAGPCRRVGFRLELAARARSLSPAHSPGAPCGLRGRRHWAFDLADSVGRLTSRTPWAFDFGRPPT